LNLAENYQPVIELYQTADHPALSPKSGGSEWRVPMADKFGGFWITTCKTCGKYPPFDLAIFFLILSRCGTLHFLIVIRTSGDTYSLLGSKK
jgi:hypothetical protein